MNDKSIKSSTTLSENSLCICGHKVKSHKVNGDRIKSSQYAEMDCQHCDCKRLELQ